MKKRLVITLVLAVALMLALAISSYAATITLYSGADKTSESTTHNGALTLTGNTEANNTVTVYFTDDGRAWKAGETVSFTEDTNLYTIECSKIANYTEWKNATAGNYILVGDIDFNFATANPNGTSQGTGTRHDGGGPMALADGSTVRIFFNDHILANGNKIMFNGTDLSIYFLGNGIVNSYWGGKFMNLKFTASADCEIVVGSDIYVKGDWTEKVPLVSINDYKATSKLDLHVYGTHELGQLVSQNSTPSTGSYNVYLHDGCTLNYSSNKDGGRLIATATTPIANIVIDGGNFTFTRANMFVDNADLSRLTMSITGGNFTFSYANAMPTFVNGIHADYRANYKTDLSFNIVCKECDYEKTLGKFVDFTTDFEINNYCPNCKTVGATTVVPKIFEAKGYSISPDGTAINGGYNVNLVSLAKYEALMGDVSYGIVIANSESFGGKTFFDENNKVNTEKAIQVEIDSQYSVFDCELGYGVTSNDSLKLVVCAYVVGEHGVSFIQSETGNAVESGKIAGANFKFITLDMIVALQPAVNKED